MSAELPDRKATQRPGDQGWILVTVFVPEGKTLDKAIVQIWGKPESKREAMNRMARQKNHDRKVVADYGPRPGALIYRVRPVLADEMFGMLQEDGSPYPAES